MTQSGELDSVRHLLEAWGVIKKDSRPKLTILGGGISNLIVKAETPDGTWVVKQPLAKLRVNQEWYADRNRILKEASCLRLIRRYIGQEYAPKVLFEDRTNLACLLECAPQGTKTWKEELLNGKVDSNVTRGVANFLSQFHLKTHGVVEISREFGDITNFLQLRIDSYLVALIPLYSNLSDQINEIITGLTSTRICLVHGDFSPKNILLLPDGRLWVIDAEVAHYGNLAFDVAFCANHLIIKSVHMRSNDYLNEARRFWQLYWKEAEPLGERNFTVRVLGGLMLARVDGKSPIEYLDEPARSTIRKLSSRFVEKRVSDFDEIIDSVKREL